MTNKEQKALARRAEKAGIHTEEVACSRCEGMGRFLVPDPLDLQLLREKHGASIYAFAQSVIRPDGTKGASAGFIKMVENPDPKKGRRCPEWLLAQYLEIPKTTWKPARKGDPFASLRGLTLTDQRKALKERRERQKAAQEAKERPIRKGEIYEKIGSDPPLRFEVKDATREEVRIVRRDLDNAISRVVKAATLKKLYKLVGVAA